jgi:hypothetical protein
MSLTHFKLFSVVVVVFSSLLEVVVVVVVVAGLERGKYEEPEVGEGDIRDRRGG